MRNGAYESAIFSLNESVMILEALGNPRQLWQTHAFLASALNKLGKSSEAREQWGAAAEVIHDLADSLTERELQTGFLEAKSIRAILLKTES
jgi:hypothetical protein